MGTIPMGSLDKLRVKYPWPEKKPDVPENPDGWFAGQNRLAIRNFIEKEDPILIVELGSWLGMSTRFFCEHSSPETIVIAIDHWKGSVEHQNLEAYPFLPVLYETFITNCWSLSHKLIPMRTDTMLGIEEIYQLGLIPDLFYLDAAHDTKSVLEALLKLIEFFPDTPILGDDWTWKTVREAVYEMINQTDYNISTFTTCYMVTK